MEKVLDFTVTRFDGEGVISKQLAKKIDKQYCGKHIHSSFQIRMPFVKGMVHKVDFKDFLKSGGCDTITDIFGVQHPVDEVEMILTKSMFKGYGWLTENGKSWEDYLSAFRKYDHALYITNVNKPKTEAYTTLNYQFLNTLSMTAEEFRPLDLPEGWERSPADPGVGSQRPQSSGITICVPIPLGEFGTLQSRTPRWGGPSRRIRCWCGSPIASRNCPTRRTTFCGNMRWAISLLRETTAIYPGICWNFLRFFW